MAEPGTLRARFLADGAILMPRVLDRRPLALAEACFEWTLAHPGPGAGPVLIGTPGTFYQDQANPDAFPAYRIGESRNSGLRYRREDVLRWLECQRVEPAAASDAEC